MKQLNVAGGSLLTGDDLADAVLELAAAVADHHHVELVEIPYLAPDGATGRARILLSPATQAWSKSVASGHDELLEPETVAAIRVRADGFGRANPIGEHPPESHAHED